MDGSNCMLGRSKPNENYHIYKLLGPPQSESISDHWERMEAFNEEDVWGGVDDAETKKIGLQEKGCIIVTGFRSKGIKEENSSYGTNSAKIPRKGSCHEEKSKGRTTYQSSAPVNIPDWSQIAWKEKRNENYKRTTIAIVDKHNSDDDEDGSDFERIPPHEVIAKQLSHRQTTSSVYEGVGRTLKGRDLSQDAIECVNIQVVGSLQIRRLVSVIDEVCIDKQFPYPSVASK